MIYGMLLGKQYKSDLSGKVDILCDHNAEESVCMRCAALVSCQECGLLEVTDMGVEVALSDGRSKGLAFQLQEEN